MIESVVGMAIAAMASAALLLAIGIQKKALRNSANYNLTISEKELVRSAGYSKEDLNVLQIDINNIK